MMFPIMPWCASTARIGSAISPSFRTVERLESVDDAVQDPRRVFRGYCTIDDARCRSKLAVEQRWWLEETVISTRSSEAIGRFMYDVLSLVFIAAWAAAIVLFVAGLKGVTWASESRPWCTRAPW